MPSGIGHAFIITSALIKYIVVHVTYIDIIIYKCNTSRTYCNNNDVAHDDYNHGKIDLYSASCAVYITKMMLSRYLMVFNIHFNMTCACTLITIYRYIQTLYS